LIEMLVELHDENNRLRAMLETVRRALYGARSERFETDPAQLALDLEDLSAAPIEPQRPKPRPHDQPRPKAVRNIGSLPKHLPHEDVVIAAGSWRPLCDGARSTTVDAAVFVIGWVRRRRGETVLATTSFFRRPRGAVVSDQECG